MSRITTEILDEVERSVQGTCESLQSHFNSCADYYKYNFEFEDLTYEEELEVIKYVEERHFECAQCGWWCETGDWAENQPNDSNGDICTSCGAENDG